MELRNSFAWIDDDGKVSVAGGEIARPEILRDWDCVAFSLDDVPDLIEDLTRLMEDNAE